MPRLYFDFEEVREDLSKQLPPTVYKYRSWDDKFHKGLLLHKETWFSHPFDLNDPLDIRPDTQFDSEEFKSEKFLDKLLSSAGKAHPELLPDDQKQAAYNQWRLLQKNPKMMSVFLHDRILNRRNYDSFGVFSTSIDDVNIALWEKYGDMHRGYCLGFKTLELCKQMRSTFGYVTYSDAPYRYSFLQNNEGFETLYLKKTSWQYENEFRFITTGIDAIIDVKVYAQRTQIFSPDAVAEIILGANISESSQNEILDIVKANYPNILSYKMVPAGASYAKIKL